MFEIRIFKNKYYLVQLSFVIFHGVDDSSNIQNSFVFVVKGVDKAYDKSEGKK